MRDFLVIGDITTDNILQITNSKVINTIDSLKHTISFPFPSKLQLQRAPKAIGGGNAFTVSHALNKLGLQTMIYSIVGNDFPGRQLVTNLETAGVDVSLVKVDEEKGTNSSFILAVGTDRLILSYHYDREYELEQMPEIKYVFLTSIGEDDRKLFKQLLRHKSERDFVLIFAPGTRQIREDFGDVKDVLANTDYLVLNKREAIEMSRLNTDHNETLLKELMKHGPKNVVITRADKGSIGFDGQNTFKVGALKVKVLETTGAGDTFAATFAAAIASGRSMIEAMEWGAINAAEVTKQIGCVEWQMDMQKLIESHAANKGSLVYTDGHGDQT